MKNFWVGHSSDMNEINKQLEYIKQLKCSKYVEELRAWEKSFCLFRSNIAQIIKNDIESPPQSTWDEWREILSTKRDQLISIQNKYEVNFSEMNIISNQLFQPIKANFT